MMVACHTRKCCSNTRLACLKLTSFRREVAGLQSFTLRHIVSDPRVRHGSARAVQPAVYSMYFISDSLCRDTLHLQQCFDLILRCRCVFGGSQGELHVRYARLLRLAGCNTVTLDSLPLDLYACSCRREASYLRKLLGMASGFVQDPPDVH